MQISNGLALLLVLPLHAELFPQLGVALVDVQMREVLLVLGRVGLAKVHKIRGFLHVCFIHVLPLSFIFKVLLFELSDPLPNLFRLLNIHIIINLTYFDSNCNQDIMTSALRCS